MLAIHWTPVNNTKHILKNGITKDKRGVFCFPLTGDKYLDKWWVRAFNDWWRPRKKYNGIIFRIEQDDLPAYFGHWINSKVNDDTIKPYNDLKELTNDFRNALFFRVGHFITLRETFEWPKRIDTETERDELYISLGKEAVENGSEKLNIALKEFTFEDYEIILSRSISPDRIIKVVSADKEPGRVAIKKKKYSYRDKEE